MIGNRLESRLIKNRSDLCNQIENPESDIEEMDASDLEFEIDEGEEETRSPHSKAKLGYSIADDTRWNVRPVRANQGN